MASDTPGGEPHNNPDRRRYELHVADQVAYIEYMLHGGTLTLTHTEVPEALEGQGIGSRLARFALEDARANGYSIMPLCPFVSAYIRRHPEYQPLIFGYQLRKQDGA